MPDNTNQKLNSPSPNARNSSTRPSSGSGHTQRAKGKSKYASKSRGKAKGKPVVVKLGPTFSYTSACCSAPATKTACTRVGKKEALVQGLGTWHCSACGKRSKVTVSKAKAPETARETGTGTVHNLVPFTEVPIVT